MVRLKHVWPILLAFMVAPRCFAQEPKAAPQIKADPQLKADPQITVDVDVTCEVVAPAQCKGGAGFHVAADGTVRTGPQGQTTGRLTSGDLSSLKTAAGRLLKAPAIRPCLARPILPGVSETIRVSNGSSSLELHGVGGKLDPRCGGPRSSAYDFFRLADELMRRYSQSMIPKSGRRFSEKIMLYQKIRAG
jgi:hypothetical protein